MPATLSMVAGAHVNFYSPEGERGKGKSGGYRVITFFTGSAFPVFLLNAFAKNEKVNLTKLECAALKRILVAIAAPYEKRKESK
jgi:hypothetical protein